MRGAETAVVWDTHLGGHPICLIGIENRSLMRDGHAAPDGPAEWTGATLFPRSSKKIARSLNATSGSRAVVILANLAGFDGSPESMRELQLEYGAEIARAVVNFRGPILFVVTSRYHGGAYVVFSTRLNDSLHAIALAGSYASVIGGGPAATVIFSERVRRLTEADARVIALRQRLVDARSRFDKAALRSQLATVRAAVHSEHHTAVAAEFDQVHSVARAKEVGSLDEIVAACDLRRILVARLDGDQ
jgi:acetyl-CoA carboxylase carboxyltransferase component